MLHWAYEIIHMLEVITLPLGFLSALLGSLMGAFSGGGASFILFPLLLLYAPGTYGGLFAVTKVSAAVMCFISGKIHASKNTTHLTLLACLIIFGLVGTGIGTYWLQFHTDEKLFQQLLAITLLGTAAYLFFSEDLGLKAKTDHVVSRQQLVLASVFSLFVNIFNGLFGGTGIFLTIFLVSVLRLSFLHSLAYTMLTYTVINLLQSSYLLATESVNWWLLLVVVVGSIVGAWAGTKLQYLKGNAWVKNAAIIMMILVGFKMLAT